MTKNLYGCIDELGVQDTAQSILPLVCTDMLEGVGFTLLHDVAGISTTYTSDFSRAIFNFVPEGTATVRLGLPEGYDPPAVFCET